MPIDEDILTEHADEAACLWSLRDFFARRPQVRLADLAEHDERIEAHLDGLRLAGAAGWRVATEVAAQSPGPGSLFVLAALASGPAASAEQRAGLVDLVVADPTVESVSGVVAGSTWIITPQTAVASAGWWSSDVPVLQQAALGIDVASGVDPAQRLTAACTHADPALRARALQAVGELGRLDLQDRCRTALTDAEPSCRNAALWSLLVSGDTANSTARAHVSRVTDAWSEPLTDLAARRLPRAVVMDWLKVEAKGGHLRRAVQLAGAHADSLVMPWLLLQLKVPAVARLAGQAFSLITGVDLEEAALIAVPPAGFHAGPSDDPADPDVALDPDEYLPWPDAVKVSDWWAAHAAEIPAGVRHLLGRPLSREHLDGVLRSGTQPQRAAAASERALLRPGRRTFDIMAPAQRQLAASGATNVASAPS